MTKQDTMSAANSNKRDIVQEESCRSTKNKTMTKAKNIKIVRNILKKTKTGKSTNILPSNYEVFFGPMSSNYKQNMIKHKRPVWIRSTCRHQ